MCVDCRTQTLRTGKSSCRLTATHKAGCRPQRPQWTSAIEGRSADGERLTGKVAWGNKMAGWNVPTKRRWQCRHTSFTPQLHSVCVERRRGQVKRDAWKSRGEYEIQNIVEPSREDSCGGNWEEGWTATLTGCSRLFHTVASGQNCHRGGLDPKPICVSSTACCENHKDDRTWQVELVH